MTIETRVLSSAMTGTGMQAETLMHVISGGKSERAVYIQAGLHADEHPGMLVIQHLLAQLGELHQHGSINGKITLVPYANPIGMMQNVLGCWTGRFSLSNGENFNRNFPDVVSGLEALSVEEGVHHANPESLFTQILQEKAHDDVITAAKKALLREAIGHDVILDLHCDTAGILHLYTHERYPERAVTLAAAIGAPVVLLESFAGGGAFDEACTLGWQWLADRGAVPASRIPFSVSLELRGQADVSDELAAQDARRIIRFLESEQIITCREEPAEELIRDNISSFPLEGATHLAAPGNGLVVWKKKPGEWATCGETIGEIVVMESVSSGQRLPIISPIDGIILVQPLMKLVRTGQRVALIAGGSPLADRRKGKLLMHF
ncbi:M14 family zinc carboxypeptidase [Pantoea cypripedii]|uniref:Succinylglutamate desuccinylase n=1 Tax=Pantoea cypripedii TaxID=55209 RepID=A0A6B9GGN2_PANCY|nr:succinylglutamate desuccinylase/aspartoacylase family protein [Pantoea cypripedii]QGY32456.1 succinylglutamate desuccinylase [Pantoea cypripedii]